MAGADSTLAAEASTAAVRMAAAAASTAEAEDSAEAKPAQVYPAWKPVGAADSDSPHG